MFTRLRATPNPIHSMTRLATSPPETLSLTGFTTERIGGQRQIGAIRGTSFLPPRITTPRIDATHEFIPARRSRIFPRHGGFNSEEHGRPISHDVREKMEYSLGEDFSNVRIVEGSQTDQLHAQAFTCNERIYFPPGGYKPESRSGQAVLGHELAHIVQQRQGKVEATGWILGVPVNTSPFLEREASERGRTAARYKSSKERSSRFRRQRPLGSTNMSMEEVLTSETESRNSGQLSVATSKTSGVIQRLPRAGSGPCYVPAVAGFPWPRLAFVNDNAFKIEADRGFSEAQRTRYFENNILGMVPNIPLAVPVNVHPSHQTIPIAGAPIPGPPGLPSLVRPSELGDILAQVDHIFPESRGGGNTYLNAQFVTAAANIKKGNVYPDPLTGANGTRIYLPLSIFNLPAGTLLATNAGPMTVTIPANFHNPPGGIMDTGGMLRGAGPMPEAAPFDISLAVAQANGLAPGFPIL